MMTIEKASSLLDKANIWAEISWRKQIQFNGDYEDIYELCDQPRSGLIYFRDNAEHHAGYIFDQMSQKVIIITEPADLGIQYLIAMRTLALEVAER